MSSSVNQLIVRMLVEMQGEKNFKQLTDDLQQTGTAAKTAGTEINAGLAQVPQGAEKATSSLGMFRNEIDGISHRDVGRALSGGFVALNTVVSALDGQLDETSKKMSEIVKGAGEIAIAFTFSGIVGGAIAALGIGLGLLVAEQQKQEAENKSEYDSLAQLQKGMLATGEASSGLAKSIQDAFHFDKDIADALAKGLESGDKVTEKQIQDLAALKSQIISTRQELEHLQASGPSHATAGAVEAYKQQVTALQAKLKDLVGAYGEADQATRQLSMDDQNAANAAKTAAENVDLQKQKWADYQTQLEALHPLLMQAAQDQDTLASAAQRAFDAIKSDPAMVAAKVYGEGYANQMALEFSTEGKAAQAVTDWNNAQTVKEQQAGIEAGNKFAEGFNSAVKSIASDILQPTEVTSTDMAMAKMGLPTPAHFDEYARRMRDVANKAAASPWASMIPADVLAKGEAAIKAFAQAEVDAFYAGQRLDKVDFSALESAATSQIDKIIGQFELLQKGEEAVRTVLQKMAKDDPQKYQEFLKAENLAPNTSATEAAKKTWQDVTKPATQYKDTVQQIPPVVGTTANWDDKGARGDITSFVAFVTDSLHAVSKAGFHVSVESTTESSGTGTGSSPSDLTPPPAGGPPVQGGFAYGGAGITPPQGMWAYIHGNEPFWAGGTSGDYPIPKAFGGYFEEANKFGQGLGGITATDFALGQKLFTPGLTMGSNEQVQQWALSHLGDLEQLYNDNPAFWDAFRKSTGGNNVQFFNAVESMFTRRTNPYPDKATHPAGSGGGGGGGGSGGGAGGGAGGGSGASTINVAAGSSLTINVASGANITLSANGGAGIANTHVNVTGNEIAVRDEQDVADLANRIYEVFDLKKRTLGQHGVGF